MNSRLAPWITGFLMGAVAFYVYLAYYEHHSPFDSNTPFAPQKMAPVETTAVTSTYAPIAAPDAQLEMRRSSEKQQDISIQYAEYEARIRDLQKQLQSTREELTHARAAAGDIEGKYKDALAGLENEHAATQRKYEQVVRMQQREPVAASPKISTIAQAITCVSAAPALSLTSTDKQSSTLRSIRWRVTDQGIVFTFMGNPTTDRAIADERQEILRELAESVAAAPQLTVMIKPRPASTSNDDVQASLERAEGVRVQLIKLGLAPGRIGLAPPVVATTSPIGEPAATTEIVLSSKKSDLDMKAKRLSTPALNH